MSDCVGLAGEVARLRVAADLIAKMVVLYVLVQVFDNIRPRARQLAYLNPER